MTCFAKQAVAAAAVERAAGSGLIARAVRGDCAARRIVEVVGVDAVEDELGVVVDGRGWSGEIVEGRVAAAAGTVARLKGWRIVWSGWAARRSLGYCDGPG